MAIRATQAAEILGVSAPTVRRWSQEGILPHERNAAGQRIYTLEALETFKHQQLGTMPRAPEQVLVFYVRSSGGLESSLQLQEDVLTQQFGVPAKVHSDKASGLNDNRRGLTALLRDAKEGKFTTVAVTHEDRLARFGTRFLREMLQERGVEVVTSEEAVKSPEEELMQDFMSLLASFSGKFYRLRGWREQKRLLGAAAARVEAHG